MPYRPTWRVVVWTQAPGEFPEDIMHTVELPAISASSAISDALIRVEKYSLNPVVVSVERIRPPASQPG